MIFLIRALLVSSACWLTLALGRAEVGHDFRPPPLDKLIPPDKQLDPAWVASLSTRGEPHLCTGPELAHIGMPVGGLFAGQLYLGGDGRLWYWDIFNDFYFTGWSGNYSPLPVTSPLEQSFSLMVDGKEIPLDASAFSQISFRGEYPLGLVNYRDPKLPVEVHLAAYSPFIPLNTDDSSLPLTVMEYTLKNASNRPVTVTLKGTLENFVLARERGALNGHRVNAVTTTTEGGAMVSLLKETIEPETTAISTDDRVIEDWAKNDFTGWKVEGTAFGSKPYHVKELTAEQQKVGLNKLGDGVDGFVSSLGCGVSPTGVQPVGCLTSAPFVVDRKHLYVWIRPESRQHNTSGLDVLVDGKVVASVHPAPSHSAVRELHLAAVDVSPFIGRQAVVRLVNDEKDPRAGVTVGKIFLSDREMLFNAMTGRIERHNEAEDNGAMALALLGAADCTSGNQQVAAPQKLVGYLGRTVTLKPGETQAVTFLVAWYFPNLNHIPHVAEQGRWYAGKFSGVDDVMRYFAKNRDRLMSETRQWHNTWYDSTLPYWFLDRTMIPTDNLATSSNYRFKNGRWWAWEGVGSCEGTCGHVYGYAQAVGRLFPDIERDQRERIDFGTSLSPEGWIDCRGESKGKAAIDAQGFYILRTLREHQMTADNSFLLRVWPGAKKAMDYMIRQDPGEKGVVEGAQHNTLDADWYGEVSWYNGVYLAALRAAAEMADTVGEKDYAKRCRKIADAGAAYMAAGLFNGEYFQNKVDPAHLNTINSGTGSEIDQVLGQSWAFQVGLPRVLPQKETVSALQSLWKYNFAPDVGPYRVAYKPGRVYAVAGEGGLLMCTFPRADWDFAKASGQGNAMYAGYFDECMTGFEHQVAGHMIWEGTPDSDLVTKGLAVERAIHDRYAPAKRNPYNEVECGDHYGRAMAAYGVFLAACGFQYDGPQGSIGFAPKVHPENFKAAFTSAQGWGSYSQKIEGSAFNASIEIKWGELMLKTLSVQPAGVVPRVLTVILNGKELPAKLVQSSDRTQIVLNSVAKLQAGQTLQVTLRR